MGFLSTGLTKIQQIIVVTVPLVETKVWKLIMISSSVIEVTPAISFKQVDYHFQGHYSPFKTKIKGKKYVGEI